MLKVMSVRWSMDLRAEIEKNILVSDPPCDSLQRVVSVVEGVVVETAVTVDAVGSQVLHLIAGIHLESTEIFLLNENKT
jgi:type IV secretory pathway protease TraF